LFFEGVSGGEWRHIRSRSASTMAVDVRQGPATQLLRILEFIHVLAKVIDTRSTTIPHGSGAGATSRPWRTSTDLLEEVLQLVRDQGRSLSDVTGRVGALSEPDWAFRGRVAEITSRAMATADALSQALDASDSENSSCC
jgi:hypothetical protein